MADPFLGEIRMFSFNWAPTSWALANGATMQIRQSQALYSLLGTMYGGDGNITFKLPDLQGRTPLCVGRGASGTVYQQGNGGGVEVIALTAATMPPHTHTLNVATAAGDKAVPSGTVFATAPAGHPIYAPAQGATTTAINGATVGATGAGAAHQNMQPFAVVNFCIALSGVWPPRD